MRGFGNTKLWCHMSMVSGGRFTNKEIRLGNPLRLKTYRELVPVIAKIANHNPDFSLFFRGQIKESKLKSGSLSFYPTIFRKPGGTLSGKELSERYEILDKCSDELVVQLESAKIEGIEKIKKFPEIQWSILQHYGVCATPLLDVTQSLRVAVSFTFMSAGKKVYIFVFAFPHPQGTITYSTEDELLNVRLLSSCPSDALHPHFQEGFLVGTFPSRVKRKQPSLDFGRRLVAKIEILKTGFWDTNFHAIPEDALFPKVDAIESLCLGIKNRYGT